MLPARSHATSVGRLNVEPGVPDPGAPPPRAAAAAGAAPRPPPRAALGRRATPPRAAARRRHRPPPGRTLIASGFRPSTRATRPSRVELDDLAGRLVDRPDVVLRIDPQTDRRVEAVDVLPQLALELAVPVELQQARAAARERAVVAERRVRMAGARVDEDLALRILPDAADFADEQSRAASSADRQWRRTRISGTRLRRERGAERHDRRGHAKP